MNLIMKIPHRLQFCGKLIICDVLILQGFVFFTKMRRRGDRDQIVSVDNIMERNMEQEPYFSVTWRMTSPHGQTDEFHSWRLLYHNNRI